MFIVLLVRPGAREIWPTTVTPSRTLQGGAKIDCKPDEQYEAKVKELEISLLECATEYEVQIVEMKMKTLQMKSEHRQKETGANNTHFNSRPINNLQDTNLRNRQHHSTTDVDQNADVLKKRANRYFESQKRSLEETENLVSNLQKRLSKKEQELLNSKVREKELAGQIHALQTNSQRGNARQVDPNKLPSMLLALTDWLQSVKAGLLKNDPYVQLKAIQTLPHLQMNFQDPQVVRLMQSPRIENLAFIVNKEIRILQEILGRLRHRKFN